MGGPSGWWTRETSPTPTDVEPLRSAHVPSWSHIVEETPDPQGKFWASVDQARALLRRVTTGDPNPDPALLRSLSEVISSESGAREQTPK